MVKRFLGIDIGTYNISISNVTVKGAEVTFDSPLVVRTPELLVQNGRLAEAGELSEILKAGMAKIGARSRKALVIINDTFAVTRDINLPTATPKEIEKMIKIDASEYLPFDVNEYTLRHRILVSSDKNSNNTNYILTSLIKTDLAMDLYKAIRSAGIRPLAIDISINSMIKYLQRTVIPSIKETAGKAVAMLDFGATTSKLVVVSDKKPVFQKVIPNNPRKIDIMLATLLNMERDKAEKIKIQYGLSYLYEAGEDNEAKAVGPVIENQINLLISDVYTALNGYTSRNGIVVSEIILTGGLSMMKGFRQFIEAAYSIPCSLVRPVGNVKVMQKEGSKMVSAEDIANMFPYFSNIAGAAYRED